MGKEDFVFELSDEDHNVEHEIQSCKDYSCVEVALWLSQKSLEERMMPYLGAHLSPLDFPLIDPVLGIGQEAEVILPCKAASVCLDAARCVKLRLLDDDPQTGQESMFVLPKYG